MLSFGYAMLAKECTVALMAEGLIPGGDLSQAAPRQAGACFDLMEEFRPLVVDSAKLSSQQR